MKKVLMICYEWPPARGVGWLRAAKFAKYLGQFGWTPTVLTAQERFQQSPSLGMEDLGAVQVIRTDFVDVIQRLRGSLARRKSASRDRSARPEPLSAASDVRNTKGVLWPFSRFIREMATMPDDKIGWKAPAVSTALHLVRKEGFQAVFSTSPPETAHLIAREIKKKTGIPWVADLRDLWSGYHFYYRGFVKTLFLRNMEQRVLGDADAVITVSQPWADDLARSAGSQLKKEKLFVITNGFDQEDYPESKALPRKDKFILAYAGKLHQEKQDPEILFRCMSDLIRDRKIDRSRCEIDFYIYGYDRPNIRRLASRYALEDVVFEKETVSHKRCMEVLAESSALVFFGWSGARGGYGHYSAKIFEYLGAKRPIIAVLTLARSCVEDLIRTTGSGYVVKNDDELRAAILRLYEEHQAGGPVFRGDESEIQKYSRLQKTRELAGLLNSVSGSR